MSEQFPSTTPGAELPPVEPSALPVAISDAESAPRETPATVEYGRAPKRRFAVSDKVHFLATSFFTQFLRILTTLAMARLLTDADYGLVTLAGALPALVSGLGDLGVARSIVQLRDDPREKLEDAGLVISGVIGAVLFMASAASGAFLAWYKADVRLLWIGPILGMTMLLGTLYQFQMACLNRDLKFRTEAWQNLIFSVATMATGLTLAFLGWGVFALVLQPLVAQVLASIAVYKHHPLRWPRRHDRRLVRKMLSYGGRVTLAQYLSGLQQTLISLVVGFAFGATSERFLGRLGRATQIRDLVGHNISSSFDRLLYPMLRSIMTGGAEDAERVRSLVLRGLSGVSLLCTFSWAWMTVNAEALVRVMLGPNWPEVPILLQAVAPMLLFTAPSLMAIVVTHALGKPMVWLRFTVVSLVLLVIGLAAGMPWGLLGIAVGITAAQAVGGMVFAVWAARAIGLPMGRAVERLAPIVAAGVAAGAAMMAIAGPVAAWSDAVAHWMAEVERSIVLIRSIMSLAIVSATGSAVYGLVIFVLARETWREVKGLVRRSG